MKKSKKVIAIGLISLMIGSSSTLATEIISSNAPTYSTSISASTDFRKDIVQDGRNEVWQKNNFLEMRIALEKLTGTRVDANGPNGMLYVSYGSDPFAGNWENKSTKDINYLWGTGNKYLQAWMDTGNNRQELAKVASLSFSDVKGTEWYASHIPCAVYYGLVNGYTDGTFKGNAPVSRAEFATMLNNSTRVFIDKEVVDGVPTLAAHKGQWYYTNTEGIGKGPMPVSALSVNDMNSGMTRGEVAMVLARKFFSNDFVEAYNTVSSSAFSDIKQVGGGLVDLSDSDKVSVYKNALKTPSTAPREIVAATNVLKEMGIMGGDANGNSNWTKPVTRAEVIALMERVSVKD